MITWHLPEDKKPVYDEKVNFILEQLKEGKSREEIAEELDYASYKSMDMYLRRKNFRWNSDRNIYEPKHKQIDFDEGKLFNASSKEGLIIRLLKNEDQDPREVAQKVGFNDHREMAEFMERKDYIWSAGKRNYIKEDEANSDVKFDKENEDDGKLDKLDSTNPGREDMVNYSNEKEIQNEYAILQKFIQYQPVFEYLEDNLDTIKTLVEDVNDGNKAEIPRYAVPGTTKTKSVYMADKLAALVTEFSKTNNLSQREIFEGAIIEYLRKYGYGEAVDSLLKK